MCVCKPRAENGSRCETMYMPLCLGNSRYPAGETPGIVDRGIRGSGSADRSPGIPIIAVILDASMTPPLSSVPRPSLPSLARSFASTRAECRGGGRRRERQRGGGGGGARDFSYLVRKTDPLTNRVHLEVARSMARVRARSLEILPLMMARSPTKVTKACS